MLKYALALAGIIAGLALACVIAYTLVCGG